MGCGVLSIGRPIFDAAVRQCPAENPGDRQFGSACGLAVGARCSANALSLPRPSSNWLPTTFAIHEQADELGHEGLAAPHRQVTWC
jgi:hypothetical protein